MAKLTAGVPLNSATYTLIASSAQSFSFCTKADDVQIAYAASTPAAATVGETIVAGTPYGCASTTANCYAKCSLTSGITLGVTTE